MSLSDVIEDARRRAAALREEDAHEIGMRHGRECASSIDFWEARRHLPGWSLSSVQRYIEGRRAGAEEVLGRPLLAP